MRETIRIVSATIHNNTNEVEIIIEKIKHLGELTKKTSLRAIWIDAEIENSKLSNED